MSEDQSKLAGKAKETIGKVSGDENLESEGRTERSKEETKEKVEGVGDKAKGAAEGVRDKLQGK